MEKVEAFFFPDGRSESLETFYAEISTHISTIEEDRLSSSEPSAWSAQATTSASISATSAAADSSTIFDDVDD